MKKLSFLLSGFLLLFFITGCTSVKRFKSATYKAQDNSLVDMNLFNYSLKAAGSETSGKNLWELSASAQPQLIQILNSRYPDNEQFTRALNHEYMVDGSVPTFDYTSMDLGMVFTISKLRDYSVINDGSGRFSPADRIEYLKFSLEIPDHYNLYFTKWNRYVTEYGEIEIADVSFTRSLELEAEGSVKEKTDIAGKGTISRGEKQGIRSRYLKLNGSISDTRIEIEEEGTREIDLSGNVIADVSLKFSGFPERLTIPLFSGGKQDGDKKDGAWPGSPAVDALKFVDVLVPRMKDAPDTIKAVLELDYVYRHVQSGWKTYQEWDDHVEYYTGTVKKEIPLFTKKDYLPLFYCIGTEHPQKRAMKIRTGAGKEYPLQFKDYSDASGFFMWLVNLPGHGDEPESGKAIKIGENTLLFNGKPITPDKVISEADLKVLPVYRSGRF